ncbi:Do family serine endopeptidase [Neorhizobium galegae]|uniref:Do family serine endopeptidase n=1 Tax=Neorhizobium galegae TaxID=399 RepID=UPI000622283B|nr:Do family serine endopeptidase [Neorhizobium galegae]CDZ25702.1 Protease Do [Neorhizobium galegae bv. officinalis]KAA9387439.1 Do family serine endopeptidase [Neorhizobium galegae]KAB1114582.1 Do family serine endopeptidase [Neorhizobium galegae]MCM2497933.1 Do family serine endopeptidase [Neorhizobium galegae]MCQ1773774.1 Do family serine endopeptidase [Neorhizobium galegae]
MAHSVRSTFKRSVTLAATFALLAAPLQAVAQTPVPAAPGQNANPPAAGSPGAMLPAPPTPSPTINPPPAPGPIAGAGPGSIADLVEGLLDAVVNISTSQSVKDQGAGPQPQIQEGSPFQEFFEDFFDGQGGQNGNQKVSSLGSGFVIDPSGYVVTNNHVIEGADDIEVIFPNGSKLKARLVGTDTKTDLSVLKVEPKAPLKAVRFGDSRRMRIGDWVMAIGNPFGLGGSVTLGIISARGRNINAGPYDNFIQTDAAINKGNSGGPLFNMRGEVIGINTAIISPSGGSIGIGFAVPTELAENVVHQLTEFGETRRGWLGVRIQPVTDDVAASLGLDKARGALVSGVVNGGPIKNGEIKAGDVILTFDGQSVNEMRDLPRIVAESPVSKEVDVVILRDGKQQTVKVTLGRLEDSADPEEEDDQPALPEGQGENKTPNNNAPGDQKGELSQDPAAAFGMTLAVLDEDRRKSFSIVESVEGVLITAVAPNSPAAQKGLKVGEVVVEVAQDFVESPADVVKRIAVLKSEGRRNAHVMVSDPSGNLRFVALPLE